MFWTTVVRSDSVDINLDAGTASLEVDDLPQKDYFDLGNALFATGATPRMGKVSFRVEWTATGPPIAVDNPAQQYRGVVREAMAQMDFSGRAGDFEFQSAPLETSTTDAAQLGTGSNGSYY